jgi:integrase
MSTATSQKAMTFGELTDLFLDRHASRYKRPAFTNQSLERYCAVWMAQPLTSITGADVATRFVTLGKTYPAMANRMLRTFRLMYRLAQEWGVYPEDRLIPGRALRGFREGKRERFIQPQELPAVLAALKEETPLIRAYFLVLLLTGCRAGEARAMQWADLDLQQGFWRKPTTKNRTAHLVPLPHAAVELFQALPHPLAECRVFPYSETYFTQAWARIRSKANIPDVHVHDLRRTCGSYLAMAGKSTLLIGKVLNHSNPASTAIYGRLNHDSVRVALDEQARQIFSVPPYAPGSAQAGEASH